MPPPVADDDDCFFDDVSFEVVPVFGDDLGDELFGDIEPYDDCAMSVAIMGSLIDDNIASCCGVIEDNEFIALALSIDFKYSLYRAFESIEDN